MTIRLLVVLLGSLAFLSSQAGAAGERTVRDFGAVGDGAADDTVAIQKAVDAGGAIRFPAGRYRLTHTVRVELRKTGLIALIGDGPAQIEMAGAGPAFHFIGTVQKSAAPADFPEDFWSREGTLSVTGLAIVGAHKEAVGLQVTRTMQLIVSQCQMRQLLHGIHFTERNRNAIISDCHIYNNFQVGIYIDHVDFHQINIGNSHISYNGGGGIVIRGGAVRNLQISGCDIEANVRAEVPPTANVLLDSTGGSIGEVEITGCTIQHYPQFPGFANIRYIGHSTAVPFTQERRHGNLIVTGNMLNDADVNLHLDGARGAVISGNTIQLATSHDVVIEKSSEVVFSNNVLDRHPRYNPERKTHGGPVQQGIVITDCEGVTLTGLQINGGRAAAAVDIRNGSRFNINGCNIAVADQIGLRLIDVRNSLVTSNVIEATGEKPALQIRGGSGNLAERNLVQGRSELDSASVAPARSP
jgi:hypothetical protein